MPKFDFPPKKTTFDTPAEAQADIDRLASLYPYVPGSVSNECVQSVAFGSLGLSIQLDEGGASADLYKGMPVEAAVAALRDLAARLEGGARNRARKVATLLPMIGGPDHGRVWAVVSPHPGDAIQAGDLPYTIREFPCLGMACVLDGTTDDEAERRFSTYRAALLFAGRQHPAFIPRK